MAKKVVVIRVDSKMTHIVHMENATSNPTIYGCIRIPTPERAFQDGMITDVVEIARRIKKACTDKGIHTKDAIFSITSTKIASRETSIPIVNKTKIHQLVMSQVSDLFPVDSSAYIFSYLLQGSPREDENHTRIQDVRVFAAPSEMVDCYYTLADTAGFRALAVEADGNSIFEIMRRQVDSSVAMALQINTDSTIVNIITKERLLLQRSIPYGIHAFAEVMLQEDAFQLSSEDEAYRMLAGQRVLLPRLNEQSGTGDFSFEKRAEVTDNGEYLLSNINRVIEYYNSKFKDQPIDTIICSGIGCSVAGIHELIENEVGIPVRRMESINGIRFNRKVKIDAALLQYINCFGSVFKPVRFVPREVAAKEQKKGALTGSVLIFVGLFLLSAVLAGLSMFQLFMANDERDLAQAKYDALTPVRNEYNEQMQIVADFGLYQAVRILVDTNGNHFHALIDKISAICPRSFKIQSISANEQKVTISAVSVDRLSSLSKLQMQLNTIKEIKNVKINQIAESKDALTKKKQYVYTMEFVYANAEVTDGEVQ